MEWLPFVLALLAFMAAHVIPMLPAIRAPLIARVGRRVYFMGYGLVSLALLWLVIVAAAAAPFVPVADPAPWARWAVNLVMPLAVALAVFGLAAPNPFGMGRGGAGFDPERPGILGVTRHPVMWAFALWAGVHLLANPDLAHGILFGLMLAFALAGMVMAEARAAPAIAQMGARTSALPLLALVTGRWRPRSAPPVRPLIVALLVWAALYGLHPFVIGASPRP